MKPQVTFLLNNGQTDFYAGSVVAGFITFDLAEDLTSVDEVEVKCSGKSSLRWTENHNKQTVVYSNSERYFKTPIKLLQNIPNNVLSKGQHKFPFSFVIPHNIPASFYFNKFARASVVYYLTGKIKRSGLHFNVKEKHSITVLGNTPVHEVCQGKNPMEPAVGRDSKFICCWCCKTGPLNGEVACNKTGYVPGEVVVVNATLENLTNTDLPFTKINLKRNVKLRARGKTRTFSDIPVKQEFEACNKRKTLNLNNKSVQLPVDMAPSLLPNCNIIFPQYVIELEGQISGCHINLRVPCEIMVGSPLQPAVAMPTMPTSEPPAYSNAPPAYPSEPVGVSNANYQPDQPLPQQVPPALTTNPLTGQPLNMGAASGAQSGAGGASGAQNGEYYDWNKSAFTYN